jgi:hypothetical protein
MRTPLFSLAAATLLMAGASVANAQSTMTTTSTWSNEGGTTLRQYSTTKHYDSYSEPTWKPSVGMEVPHSATVYPLPETMHVPSAERYSYSIINNDPVIVERTTRKVVHSWD